MLAHGAAEAELDRRVSWPASVTAARNRSASKRAPGLRVTSAVSSSSVTRTFDTTSSFLSDRSSPAAHRLQVSPFTTILTSSICADAHGRDREATP